MTDIHEDLDAEVADVVSADAFVHFGPPAALNMPSWMAEIRQKARQSVLQAGKEGVRARAKARRSLPEQNFILPAT